MSRISRKPLWYVVRTSFIPEVPGVLVEGPMYLSVEQASTLLAPAGTEFDLIGDTWEPKNVNMEGHVPEHIIDVRRTFEDQKFSQCVAGPQQLNGDLVTDMDLVLDK